MTVKLSRLFYERFGDEIANELAEWLNSVDASTRSELRELNTQNFRQFDASLEQRTGELTARIDQLRVEFDARLEQRTGELAAKIEQLRAEFDARLEQRLAETRAELRTDIAALRTDLQAFKAELLKWMFLFWLGTVATMLSVGNMLWG